MRDALVIFGIAALVAVAFCVAWLVAVLRDGRRLRGMRYRLRPFIEEVERDADDDETKTMPIVTGDVP